MVPILEHVRSEPSRTWSIVVTIFGDTIVPRGGSLWLGSLLSIFDAMGVKSGVVRTAMSRLAADDWLQRRRVGRNSFYSLTGTGRAVFTKAAEQIYGSPDRGWDGQFQLVLPGDASGRDVVRAALRQAGFGSVASDVWVAPAAHPVPPEAASLLRLQSRTDLATGRQLVERAWNLADIAGGYRKFLEAFEPLGNATTQIGRLSDLDALVARILLIHEYRRVVLRDPLLPLALLPERWPGTAARKLTSEIYQAVLPGSERWLDGNAVDENGALPAPSINLGGRFRDAAPNPSAPTFRPERVTENL